MALQEYAAAKEKQSMEDREAPNPASTSARKLRAHEVQLQPKKFEELEKRSLSLTTDKPPLPRGTIVIATQQDEEPRIRDLG